MKAADTQAIVPQSVLIVEDESKLASVLADYLGAAGYRTHVEGRGDRAAAAVERHAPDLVLLDLMLPGRDGIEICRELRQRGDIPIVMITARVEEIDRLLGLEVGADDYICKPFSPREVVARVKAILRRAQSGAPMASLELSLDESTYRAEFRGQPLELTPVEFRLLKTLLSAPGRVFSRDQLLDRAHTTERAVTDRAVDSHVKNLRHKLQQACPERELIRSVYGVGYKLEP